MIDFTNYRDHSERKGHVVFYFSHKEQSLYFEDLLQQNELFFEKQMENVSGFMVYYVVKKSDFPKASELNNLSEAKFRKPFIADNYLRYTVLFLFFLMVLIALTGAIITSIK